MMLCMCHRSKHSLLYKDAPSILLNSLPTTRLLATARVNKVVSLSDESITQNVKIVCHLCGLSCVCSITVTSPLKSCYMFHVLVQTLPNMKSLTLITSATLTAIWWVDPIVLKIPSRSVCPYPSQVKLCQHYDAAEYNQDSGGQTL
jgi:hypothetical protein